MAKRKTKKVQLSRAQLMQKRRGKLDKEFLCYYCQHEKSVAIKIDNQTAVGFLACRVCGVKFSTRVTALDEAVDVYAFWVDSCRESERLESQGGRAAEPPNAGTRQSASQELTRRRSDSLQRAAAAAGRSDGDREVEATPSTTQIQSRQGERPKPAKRLIREEELTPKSFSVIAGSKRSKRIIDAVEETPDEPEFTVDTLTGENLFDDD